MRTLVALSVLLVVSGCGKAHRPSKGVAAKELQCKRGGVERSEPFETTWTGSDGVLRVRYRVGVSCTKPKGADSAPKDLWQVCSWVNDSWKCGSWQSGAHEGGPAEGAPGSVYMKPEERGRVDE